MIRNCIFLILAFSILFGFTFIGFINIYMASGYVALYIIYVVLAII